MKEDEQELISRGLDADLNRQEMRKLYKLVAKDDEARVEAGELAELENDLALLAATSTETELTRDFAAEIQASMIKAEAKPKVGLIGKAWKWLRSPDGLSIQPLSFASGIAIAAVALFMVNPVMTELQPEEARFIVNDMQFTKAQTTVDWTYQFIVTPGGATRVALDQGDDLPMHFQFESSDNVPLVVSHETPGRKKTPSKSFTVDGIGFATLMKPLAGDSIVVHNNGKVPVVVYAYTNGYGGSGVFPDKNSSKAL
ncbi:MAG: hypothetical protein OQJ97_09755 [Rhodospirillales bacterium]|nr:hypothetical protein [Rhodospirillales bacterium]